MDEFMPSASNQWKKVESAIPYSSAYSHAGNRYPPKFEVLESPKTHSIIVGFLLWCVGFFGVHRFYYGKVGTGVLYFFTLGLFGIGWLIDAFLISSMANEADRQFAAGPKDYSIAWLLLILGGRLGFHRFYQEKWGTGLIYCLPPPIFGFGVIYDFLTLNQQVDEINRQ